MQLSDYPLFVPARHLSEKVPRQWSAREAKDYLEWLLSVIQPRTEYLLECFGETLDDDPELLLDRMGWKASSVLRQPEFSHTSGANRKLTNSGYALAADLGLLIAKMLREQSKTIEWSVKRKPKSDASYNLPVLSGFGAMELEPVGGSIAEATAVLQGRREADAWKRIYMFWKDRALARY